MFRDIPSTNPAASHQDKDKISGVCKNDRGKSYDTTVTVAENKVTFIHGGEYEGDALTLTFTGAWNDKGELNGDIDIKPLNVAGTFTAKKAEKTEKADTK